MGEYSNEIESFVSDEALGQGTEATFHELLNGYERRLESLRAGLKAMVRSGACNSDEFEQRLAFLDRSRDALVQLSQQWDAHAESQGRSKTYRFRHPLPDMSKCTPSEQRLVAERLTLRAQALDEVAKESVKVINWAQGATAGKYPKVVVTVLLSAMRRKMLAITTYVRELNSRKEAVEEFAAGIGKKQNFGARPSIEIFRWLFEDSGAASSELRNLEHQLGGLAQQTGWMKRWLRFQELRMQSYFPSNAAPKEAEIQELGTEVLRSRFER